MDHLPIVRYEGLSTPQSLILSSAHKPKSLIEADSAQGSIVLARGRGYWWRGHWHFIVKWIRAGSQAQMHVILDKVRVYRKRNISWSWCGFLKVIIHDGGGFCADSFSWRHLYYLATYLCCASKPSKCTSSLDWTLIELWLGFLVGCPMWGEQKSVHVSSRKGNAALWYLSKSYFLNVPMYMICLQ